MLIHLTISDFAVVKHLNLDFTKGMSVITGETGAGKSILLDALGLALGERADSQWIRPGSEQAEISITLDISKIQGAILWLTDSVLLNPESTQECLIRRILYKNGRSKAFINGRPATTSQLKLLGEYLVQIHGQHQHQLLLKPAEQLRLLDAFGQHDNLLSSVKKAYQAYHKIALEIARLKENAHTDPSKFSLLRYQIEELESLQIQPKEWETLSEEQKRLSFAKEDLQACESALCTLEQDEFNGLLALQSAQNALGHLGSRYEALQNVLELLKTAEIHLEESVSELNRFVHHIDLNPDKLHETEARLSKLFDISRKHKVDPCELSLLFEKLSEELAEHEGLDEKLQSLEQDLSSAENRYKKVALKLSKARIKSAKQLGKEVNQWLAPLGLKGAHFEIELNPHTHELSPHGLESVQFMVSTNLGHPLMPLQKVVSGGELSRISLAIQLITARYQDTPTLVFDEVDVGVGGKIGAVIGEALHTLGQEVQVLCITHLPQVAALGDHHLQVSKHHHKQSTTTDIRWLNAKERVEEIARMLGGLNITQQARANAKTLLKKQSDSELV